MMKLTPLSLVASLASAVTAQTTTSCNIAAQNATAFAIQVLSYHLLLLAPFDTLQYAYPISQWVPAVTNIFNHVGGPNTLWPYRTLSGPEDRTIVGPNADTLYIWMVVDLSNEDLVLTIPNISDGRYWIWPFYDM
jgi:hypothetical protein